MFIFLENFSNWFTYNILWLSSLSHWGQALNFFVYDSLKIFLLLIVIIHIMTLINIYLPVEKIRSFLNSRKWFWLDHFFASIFGAITPFCSCSSIPLFVGFLKWGIPLGTTLSFLITSPLVNEVAIALFLWIFGIKITLYYIAAGVLLGTFGGLILWKLKLEKHVAEFIWNWNKTSSQNTTTDIKFKYIIKSVVRDSWKLIKKIMPYVLIWIALGGIIHWFIPTDFFEQYLWKGDRYGVPLAVILWIPMYTNASGIIPIVQSLIAKWIPLWTGLAFMMAVVGLSLPEFLILKKVMKPRLLLSFFGFIALCMIGIGYLFNILL